jgi:rod shape-determining protein MreB and related proteins
VLKWLNWFGFTQKPGNDLGIDLGTANTLICTSARGVVLREPSVVAVDYSLNPPQAIEVGLAARDMMGRTPANIKVIRPLRDGVIADVEWAEVMLRELIGKVTGGQKLFGVQTGRILISVPTGVTDVERRAVGDAAYNAGARVVNLIEEPMAAAIGAGMPVDRPTGSMIVDIGGGTTEIAVLSLNGMVVSKSLRLAGDKLNENIQDYLEKAHNIKVGERTAEAIKIRLGSAARVEHTEDEEMEIRGIHNQSGVPHIIRITGDEIRECLLPTLFSLIQGIKSTLETTPPELASDIVDRGIMLAGGGALLTGLDELISKEVDLPVHMSSDPLSAVVLGTERILTDPVYTKILDYTEYDNRY